VIIWKCLRQVLTEEGDSGISQSSLHSLGAQGIRAEGCELSPMPGVIESPLQRRWYFEGTAKPASIAAPRRWRLKTLGRRLLEPFALFMIGADGPCGQRRSEGFKTAGSAFIRQGLVLWEYGKKNRRRSPYR
jgi:hypothetical protein